MFRQALALLAKDLLLEWRGRSRSLSVLLFGVTTLLLFSFAAGADTEALQFNAPGFLTLALLLSSTLALSESFRIEQEERAMEGLFLLPVDPVAQYYGKALGNTVFLILLAPVLIPVALVLYSLSVDLVGLAELLLLWVLSSAALAAPGTLYAGMTSRLRGQDVLLPLLLFPLVVPVLIGATKAMSLIFTADPMGQFGSWVALLVAFNVVYWSICGLLFAAITEDAA
jgi:heme exporter protein B